MSSSSSSSSSSTNNDRQHFSYQAIIISLTLIMGTAGGENVLQRLSRLERFSEVRLGHCDTLWLCDTLCDNNLLFSSPVCWEERDLMLNISTLTLQSSLPATRLCRLSRDQLTSTLFSIILVRSVIPCIVLTSLQKYFYLGDYIYFVFLE